MIRHYCDACGKEIGRNVVSERFKPTFYRKGENWYAEVLIAKGATWNKGDLCLDCLKEFLSSQESRGRFSGAPPLGGVVL